MKKIIFGFICVTFLHISSSVWAINFQKIDKNTTHPEIWYNQTHTVPTISVQLSFPLGYAYDPHEKLGLAAMLAATLDEGAGDLDSTTFREALVNQQISLHYHASRKFLTLTLNFLKFDADTALSLANLSLTRPRFDKDSVHIIRNQIISSIKQSQKKPASLASNYLRQIYYKNHPFVHPASGTLKTLENIKKTDLIKHHQHISQDQAFIAITGDLTKQEAIKFSKKLLKNVPKNSLAFNSVSNFNASDRTLQHNIFLDIPQSTVIFTTPSVKRSDTQFFAYYIATHILGGGGFGSALTNNLREKNGLTYGVSAYLDSNLHDGQMLIQFTTENNKLDKALSETQKTLKMLAQKGIYQEKLIKAKTYLKGQYALAFETNNDIIALAQALRQQNLPFDYPQKRMALFDAVTLKDVNMAMKKLFSQKFTKIIVGGQMNIDNFKLKSHKIVTF